MKVAVTGATGFIASALIARLKARGDDVVALARDPERASKRLGVQAVAWRPIEEPAPSVALGGCDAVVNLLGESVGQRWSAHVKERIRSSRVVATHNLVAGLRAAESPPRVLVSASAVGYYGARGDETLDESEPPGDDFLSQVCVEWEAAAQSAVELGTRVVILRQGVVLGPDAEALRRMAIPFRLGLGGPLGSGRQYFSWIHLDDLSEIQLAAVGDQAWSGVFNATAPEPVTNRELAKTLGRVLRRPAVLPVPALALRLVLADAAEALITGQRVVPARLRKRDHHFLHPQLEDALRAALRR